MKIMLTIFIPVFLLLTLFLSCTTDGTEQPPAVNGTLDLRNRDLASESPVKLYGEWLFSWKEFVPPDEAMPSGNTSIAVIPSYWSSLELNGKSLPSLGWATYRLKILLPKTDRPLALNYKYIFTAYRLFINGIEVDSAGIPGTDKSSARPGFKHAKDPRSARWH